MISVGLFSELISFLNSQYQYQLMVHSEHVIDVSFPHPVVSFRLPCKHPSTMGVASGNVCGFLYAVEHLENYFTVSGRARNRNRKIAFCSLGTLATHHL